MSDQPFEFSCDFVLRHPGGVKVEKVQAFSPQTSVPGWACPDQECDIAAPYREGTDLAKAPKCWSIWHDEEPPELITTQILTCPSCGEYIPATRFLEHVDPCSREY